MILFPFLFTLLAQAETISGVTLPDEIHLASTPLILNGMGVREKYWLDIYVAGLYIPSYSDDPHQIIYENVPKRIHSTFIYPKVTREQLEESLLENLDRNPEIDDTTREQMVLCMNWMEDLLAGDEILFDYDPEQGTTVYVKGEEKGVIPGEEFMQVICWIYVGDGASYLPLKNALLGKDRELIR